jgi:hypothetical protein
VLSGEIEPLIAAMTEAEGWITERLEKTEGD